MSTKADKIIRQATPKTDAHDGWFKGTTYQVFVAKIFTGKLQIYKDVHCTEAHEYRERYTVGNPISYENLESLRADFELQWGEPVRR
jgi:hypothetical protein